MKWDAGFCCFWWFSSSCCWFAKASKVQCFVFFDHWTWLFFCDEEMWSSRSLWHLPDILTRNWHDAEIEIGFYGETPNFDPGVSALKLQVPFLNSIGIDTCQNNFTLPVAKALDRGLLERNGRKLDMERKVQRSSWFLTLTRFCLQDSKPHVYVHKKMIYISWISIASVTGWQRHIFFSEEKRHFSAGTLTGDQGWQFHSGTVLSFLCKTPSHWKQLEMKPNHGALTWRIRPHRIFWRNWWRRRAAWTTLAEAV